MKIVVYHQSYGCDTGCCGHVIEVDGEVEGEFEFAHPRHDEDYKDFARRLVAEIQKRQKPAVWMSPLTRSCILPEEKNANFAYTKRYSTPLFTFPPDTREIEAKALEEAADLIEEGMSVCDGPEEHAKALRRLAAAKRKGE